MQGPGNVVAAKRHAPITFDDDNKTKKKQRDSKGSGQSDGAGAGGGEQRFYKAPSGKFSGKVKNYSNNSRKRNNRNNQGKNRNFRKY